MEFVVTDKIEEKDRDLVFSHLLEFNLQRLEDKHPKDLGVYHRDENGDLLAALIGQTHGKWLTVRFLWVAEACRNQHIGTAILEKAEETAKSRGCKYAFLDTFGFQAPEFYKKRGYTEVFRLTEYPCEGSRIYFTKSLE